METVHCSDHTVGQKDLHTPHSPQTPRVRVTATVSPGPWRVMPYPSTDLTFDT